MEHFDYLHVCYRERNTQKPLTKVCKWKLIRTSGNEFFSGTSEGIGCYIITVVIVFSSSISARSRSTARSGTSRVFMLLFSLPKNGCLDPFLIKLLIKSYFQEIRRPKLFIFNINCAVWISDYLDTWNSGVNNSKENNFSLIMLKPIGAPIIFH